MLFALSLLPVATLVTPRAFSATTLTASSSAAAVNVNLVLDKKPLTLNGVGLAAGSAPPVYSVMTPKATYTKNAQTSDGKFVLAATAAAVIDKAASAAPTATAITATSSSIITSFLATLSSPSLGGVLVTMSGASLVSKASFTLTAKALSATTGSTRISKFSVSAPLLGISGTWPLIPGSTTPPAPNTILAHNADNSIIVYLNYQTTTGVKPKYTGVKVDAADVHIVGFNQSGQTVSGDIEIGSSIAQ